MEPDPDPTDSPNQDDLPPLPETIEDRLHAVLFETAGDERRRLFEELLAAHPEAAAALRARIAALAAGDSAMTQAVGPLRAPSLPRQVGRYTIRELLGEGGFGAVYRAEQHEPVHREVALKILHVTRTDARSEWRFLAERQALARMQHAHIAPIFDAGCTEDGRHYFAMELVLGDPITIWCDRHHLSIEARLELFRQVASAVQHAHQRGVVHRDLKPGNVLVREQDGRPEPKVIDFGMAKLIEEQGGVDMTREGALVGTPAYMSPEQASGAQIDTRTDVYSLGVLLYELLTGDLPFARESLGRNAAQAARVICEGEPRRLTTAVRQAGDADTVAVQRSTSVAALTTRLGGDLEWIVRRAMAKNPEHRYPSVSDLLADVERHLARLPVAARQHEALYVFERFLARHRVMVAIAALFMVTVIAAIAVLGTLLGKIDSARRVAVERGDIAIGNEYAAHLAAARAAFADGDVPALRSHLTAAAPELRGWEWDYLASFREDASARWVLPKRTGDFGNGEWLDDHRIAIAEFGGDLHIWSPSTGAVEDPPARLAHFTRWCWNRDRSRLWAIVDNHTRVVTVDTATWHMTTVYLAYNPMPGLAPLVRALLPSESTNGIDLEAAKRAALQQPRHDRQRDVRSLALSHDERILAISDNTGAIHLLPADGLGRRRQLAKADKFAWDIAWTRDDATLVVATGDGHLLAYAAADGTQRRDVALGDAGALAVVLDAHDEIAFVATERHVFRIELATGRELQRVVTPHDIDCLALAAPPDVLYGGGAAGAGYVLAWQASTLEPIGRFHGHPGRVETLAVSPDQQHVLSVSRDAVIVHARTPRPPARLLPTGFDAVDLSVSPDDEAFAAITTTGHLNVWNARTLAAELSLALASQPRACALANEAVYVLGAGIERVDRRTGHIQQLAKTTPLFRASVDPAGRWLLACGADRRRVHLFRLPTAESVGSLPMPAADHVAWDASRGAFVVGGDEPSRWWIDPTAAELRALPAPPMPRRPATPWERVASSVSSPDGRRFVVGGPDRRVRMYDSSGREVFVFDDAPHPIIQLAFVRGGSRLIGLASTSGTYGSVVVWGADVR